MHFIRPTVQAKQMQVFRERMRLLHTLLHHWFRTVEGRAITRQETELDPCSLRG